jgi:RHS repeat-associated protein
MRSIILFSLIYVLFPVFAMGQHLADVLVSLQDRHRAVEQRIQLYAYHTPNGVVGDQQLIEWTGLGTTRYPTAANVDALDLGAKVALLNQAVADFGRLAPYYLNLRADDMTTGGIGILRPYLPEDFEDLGRAGAGNYNQVITALAMQVRRLRVLTWTASLKTGTERYGIDQRSTQTKESGIWGAWVDWHDESLEPGDSEDWMPTSIGEGGKHVATQDSIYKIHWNWFNFRWEESFHVTGQYSYQETATSRDKWLKLTRTRTFPIEAGLHSKVPARTDQLSGKVALLRRVRWSPVPFTTFAADDDSWNPVNGQWQLVAIEENATGLTNLGPKEEVGVSLSWSEPAGGLQNASPTGLQAAWAGSNHLSRIYAAVCMPEFANGVDAPGVASYLAKSGRVSGAPGGDGRPLVHPLPGLMAGIPLGRGLDGFGSGWIGISPTNLAFADQRYVGEGGTVEYDSWISAARFMRFDYMSNLRFTGSAEDFHVVYEAYRDMQSRGAGLPSAQPTTTEQQQSGWNAFISISSHGGRDFFLAWDLPRIRQIVGRDLIADVEMQGHYKCVVKIYRRVVDPGADPVDRRPWVLADVSEENLIRTVVIESPGVGGNSYPLSPEKTRFTDGAHIIDVWREGFDGFYSGRPLHFKEMDGGNELYLKSIVFPTSTIPTSTVTEKLNDNSWRTRTIPGWTGYPAVFYHPDGWLGSSPRLDTFHDYPGKEISVWWNSNPPGSETIAAAGENTGVSYTRSQSLAGTQFGKFPQALTITRPDRPNETFGWDGSGILTSHEKGLWKSTATVAGNILSGTTQFNESAIGRDWTEFIDSGRSVKSYSAPDGTVTAKDDPAVDWSVLEYGSATGTGLPGLPHILTRKDGSGTTWAWTVNGDGSTGLETCDGLLDNDAVTRGTKTISITNARGYVTDTARYLLLGDSLKVGGTSTPTGQLSGWGAPLAATDYLTGLTSCRAFDGNRERYASSSDALGVTSSFTAYDALDRLTGFSWDGKAGTMAHNANGFGVSSTLAIPNRPHSSYRTWDAMGRLLTSSVTAGGTVSQTITRDANTETTASSDSVTHAASSIGIRKADGTVATATGDALPFGGVEETSLSLSGGLLMSTRNLKGLATTAQTTYTDAWGRVRKTAVTGTNSGSDETESTFSTPASTTKRVITVDAAQRHLIEECEPWAATGSIVRSGIDMVPRNDVLDGGDRYIESVTWVSGGKVINTVSLNEDTGLREILRSETNPAANQTVTKINRIAGVSNSYEETITSTTDYTARTITAVSSRGWTKTTAMTNFWQPDVTTVAGTGIPTAKLDPTWRADGSLESVNLKTGGTINEEGQYTGGATQSASFAADGKLTGLTDPLLDDVFGGHSFANGEETLTIYGVTAKRSLDGTYRKISGSDVMGQERATEVADGGFAETIQPGSNTTPTGSATIRKHNAAGVKTTHDYAAGTDIHTSWLAGGLLEKQSLARGGDIAFSYSPDGARDLTDITWPAVSSTSFGEFYATTTTLTHDTAGRVKTIDDTSGSRTLDYDRGRLWKTDYTAGPLGEYFVERHHDTLGRLDQVTLKRDGQAIHTVVFAHTDDSPEISGVTATGFSATLGRNTARHLTSVTSGSVSQSWTRGTAGRITAAGSNLSGAPSFAYTEFDTKGRRTKCTTSGGTWNYGSTGNPSSGQLTTASHPTLGSFSYTFDGIGRRASNTGSALNQFLTQTNSQTKNLLVAADPAAHVWVNGQQVQNFNGAVTYAITSPGSNGGWVPWLVHAVLTGQGEGTLGANPVYNPNANPDAESDQRGAVWVPPITENFTFDADGNRESSALWDYGWDGRNKLVRARTKNYKISTTPQGYDIACDYDSEGRRFRKNVTIYQNGSIASQNNITFVWDGWNLIYERHQLPSGLTTLERKYIWGPDIADGNAGGAGGLLLIRETRGATTTDLHPLYDGTGHVVALADNDGVLKAEYTYGPFGELIKSSGPLAQSNPIRYATKYFDTETGLYDFGQRYYDPVNGQWLSRELMGEDESINLYAYAGNDPINNVDALGLEAVPVEPVLRNGVPMMIYEEWAGTGLGYLWNAVYAKGVKHYDQSPDAGQLANCFYQEGGAWHLMSESARHNAGMAAAVAAIPGKMQEIKPVMKTLEIGGAAMAAAPMILAAGSLEVGGAAIVYGESALASAAATTWTVAGYSVTLGDALTIGGASWLLGTQSGHEYGSQVSSSGLSPAQTAGMLGLDAMGGMLSKSGGSFTKAASEATANSPILRPSVAETFAGGKATRVVLDQPLTVMRLHGGNSGKIGRFLSLDTFTSRLVARQRIALKQEWNAITKQTKVTLPVSTVIWRGQVAPQVEKSGKVWPGGGNQIWVESDLDPSWFGSTWHFKN